MLTGTILRDFAPYPGFNGEVFVTAGDLNNDGRMEIITGAGQGGGPQVNIYDGVTNAKLRQFFAFSSNFSGGVRVGTGDANGDSVADIILGAGPTGGPHIRVLDGRNMAELRSYFAYAPTFTGGVFVAGSGGGSPLMAAGGQASGVTAATATLTHEALQPIVEEAIARWAGMSVSASDLERLRGTNVTIADLPDGFLALARPDRIYIDINGAGYGWFIDPTPSSDEEFAGAGIGNRMDLLTAVMHEMGHILGLDDLDHDDHDLDLMADSLATGRRRTLAHEDIDSVFADDEDWKF